MYKKILMCGLLVGCGSSKLLEAMDPYSKNNLQPSSYEGDDVDELSAEQNPLSNLQDAEIYIGKVVLEIRKTQEDILQINNKLNALALDSTTSVPSTATTTPGTNNTHITSNITTEFEKLKNTFSKTRDENYYLNPVKVVFSHDGKEVHLQQYINNSTTTFNKLQKDIDSLQERVDNFCTKPSLKDKAFGYATAVVGLTSGLQIGGFATPFVNSCVVPLAVKAGLVKAGANFALSKLAIVGSYVGSGYCIPLLLVPLLIKCCYDAQNKNKIATTTGYLDTGSSSFGIRFKQAAKHNLSFVWNGLQPAALTILGLGFLGILAQQNK